MGYLIIMNTFLNNEMIIEIMQNIVLINNLRTALCTKILMPFLSFSDNLLQDAYIYFFEW